MMVRRKSRARRDIEQALIGALDTFGLACGRKEGLTGVWIGEEKIAAIGVRVHRERGVRVGRIVFLSQPGAHESPFQEYRRLTRLRWVGYQGRHRGHLALEK